MKILLLINEILIYIGFFGITDMIINKFNLDGWELFFFYLFILSIGILGFCLLVK